MFHACESIQVRIWFFVIHLQSERIHLGYYIKQIKVNLTQFIRFSFTSSHVIWFINWVSLGIFLCLRLVSPSKFLVSMRQSPLEKLFKNSLLGLIILLLNNKNYSPFSSEEAITKISAGKYSR